MNITLIILEFYSEINTSLISILFKDHPFWNENILWLGHFIHISACNEIIIGYESRFILKDWQQNLKLKFMVNEYCLHLKIIKTQFFSQKLIQVFVNGSFWNGEIFYRDQHFILNKNYISTSRIKRLKLNNTFSSKTKRRYEACNLKILL